MDGPGAPGTRSAHPASAYQPAAPYGGTSSPRGFVPVGTSGAENSVRPPWWAGTRPGDDVYQLSNTETAFTMVIWDGGGSDTLDASAQTLGATIDLNEGAFSSIGTNGSGGAALNNVSIASEETPEPLSSMDPMRLVIKASFAPRARRGRRRSQGGMMNLASYKAGNNVKTFLLVAALTGLSEAEFSNFMQFYRQAADRIHEQSPETQVGAGFNWDRFVSTVAPNYATGAETNHNEVLDRAFHAVILPFAEAGDIVALQSYHDLDVEEIEFPVNNLPVKESYQFLRRLEPLYDLEKPIVFYAIGTPVDSPVAYLRQQNYLEQFEDWTSGVDPEVVAWRYLLNFDGTDTSNQEPSGRCLAFTESTRPFELPQSACYDGLFTSVFSAKDPFDYLAAD